jgi:hypothetical protein
MSNGQVRRFPAGMAVVPVALAGCASAPRSGQEFESVTCRGALRD